MTPQYYTFDELRELGCPNGLLMQYVMMPKDWINEMLRRASNAASIPSASVDEVNKTSVNDSSRGNS